MDYPTTATTVGIKDLSLISSAGKNVVQSKEKLVNMSSNTKRSSQLPRSKPTAADPGSKTLKSVTKQTTLRENSEASRLPSKSISRRNTSSDEVKDSVNKTNEKNITNSKTVGGVKPIGSSKIHRNTALVKTRTPSKIASPKHPSSSSCTSNVDSPALDELKVVTELNDKFRPRSDSESSHASHSSLCSQLSTSSVKSSICLPSADRSGLAKTKKTLTSSCSRLAVSRAETKMKKQPATLSRTTSSTTVTRTNNSALSSVGKMSSDNQTSRLQSRLGAENLQRAVSTGSLKNMNTKLSIPTGRSNLTATTNRINSQALKTKTATNSSTNISANNRALHKTGTKVPVRETSRTVSTENLSAKNTNSLGKSCENLSRKPRSLLQASCENLSSKARSNRSSALSNHVADQRSSLLQSKKPSLSRSTSSSSSSSLVQQREKSSSCVSLVKDQKHTKLNGSTSSLPTVGRSDNKITGNTNTRTGSGPERKATGIGRIQGSRPNPADKAPVRKSVSVTNKKVTTVSNATDTVGKKTTLPRAPRNISDQKGMPTATSTTKTSFGIKTSKPLENKKDCKILEKGSSLKASHANDSNKTTLNESKEKLTDNDRHEPDIPCYKTNELSIENEEKLNENNSLIRGKVSKNFAYDDYMFITDSLSYDNLSEPDVYNGDSDRENKKRNHIRSPDKGLLKNNLSTSSLDISLHEDYVDDEGVVVNFVTNSDDAPHQQEQEDFPLGQHSKQPFPASYSTSYEKGVHERDGVDLISELSNRDDVIKADNSFDSSLDVSYKSKTFTSAYLYQHHHHHHHHQQQQHPNKQHPLSPHHYYQHGDSKESWSGPEDEDEEDEEESDGKQEVLPGEGKGNICGGPETDTNSANDRRCVLPGKIKRGEEMGVEDEEEENEEEKKEEQGRRGRGVQDKEEVPGVGFKKSADISKTAGPGMPMPEFRPPHISQHQHPQNITSRNDYTTTSGCNLVVGEGSTGETAVAVVTESTIETTVGTPTVAGGKAGGTKQPLGRGGGGGGGYKKEKQNYPVQKTTAATATAATTTTLTPVRGGDKTGLLTQLVAGRKEAVSLDLELQSRLDAVPIASSHVKRTNVCDIDPQRMADSLRVQSKQSKFGNYQTSSISPTTENSCNSTAADDDNDEEADSLSKDEELLMEGTASSELVNRIRDPFLASGMAILGNQMLSPCSNDSSSFKDISDDVVTPLSDVQEIFDHDDQPSDDEDAISNFGQNEEDEEESDRNLDTAGTEEDSDSGSVLIEIEDNPLPASVGNDEGEIIVEEPDYTSEERNYSDSNSSFVSDMIMGERPIVDAGEDLAEVSLDGNETQNLWLAIEAESQYDNMSTCMTLENIAESSIGEDEELFDQSPNVETDNAIGISEKFPNKKLDFFKEIPSQEFEMDSSDLTDERGVSLDDGTDMITGKNSLEMMQNNSNTQGLPNFNGDFTNKKSLQHSSVREISKLSGSQDENIPSQIADMSVDNFKSQVPKKIFEKIDSQEGYLTDIDVNSNKDILSGKGQLSDSLSQRLDKCENISCYDISQEIIPDDSPFAVLKNDATKKSKDSSPQDFTLRQLQGTLNLRKQRILELCGQMEATPNKNQKPPPSPTRSTEKTGRPTRFRSTDTLNMSPQSSSLSPSPTRHERSASISIPNSEMMQSSCSSSDGQSSPMKESWIKHEGKWKRGYVLDDGKCIPAEDYTESPNSEIIHNSLEEYENQGTSDVEEASQLSEISAADTVVDRVDELDHYFTYDESPVPITQRFQKGTETLLNTNELVSKSCAAENMAEEPVKEVTQAQETSEYEPVKEVAQVQGSLKCEKAEIARLQEFPDHEPVKKVAQAQETLRDEPAKKVAQIQEIPNKDVTLAPESLPSDRINSKKYDSVDGNLHNWTVGTDSTVKKYTDVPDSSRVAQEPSSVDHGISIVPLELPLTPSKGTGLSEQKSFSPEIVDDIPFVDVDYSENVCPSSPDSQEPYSPEIKDVKSVSGEEKTVLKKSMEVPCQENSSNLKPFSGSVTAATRPTDLDIRSSIELSVEPLSSPNSVTQVDLDGLPPVDLDQVLINDSADVSSVDLEDEPSVEPVSSPAHLNKVPTKDEQLIGQTEELNKLSHSEDIKTEKSGKIPEELDKDQTPKTDEPPEKMESLKPKDPETISDKCLPKSDTSSQALCGENPKESFTGNEEKNHRFPEDTEILHHELDNEQPEECDTPPAGYIINSFDGSGSRTPVNKQSLTPVGSVNLLLNKSDFGRSSLVRKDSKSQKLMRPQNFESEIQTNGKQDRREALKTREEADEIKREQLSALQAESELSKSDQDLTHVGSLCDEIFSIIGSPTLLYESWKTISSESSYEDASDMSSSQIESDDGRYSSRFSGSSSIYRNQGGSRSIYANIIRSSIHENSDSESSDCQDSCMSKSAQDYENLKRTKEKANNKLKGRGYWSDENSPDSLLASMDLYSDASEFAHACWSDRSTFSDAVYLSSPYKYRNDSSAFMKGAYPMKPEESHDIKLLAEISELDETFGESSHGDCTPGSKICNPSLRSSLNVSDGYWSPVSSPPTRKPYRRSLSLPFATRDGEGGRAALLKSDSEAPVNAAALGSPPDLPSKVGRSQRKHNTILNWLKDRHTISLSKVVPEISSGVVHRKTSVSCRERPKSDINVRWAQLVEQVSTFPEPRRRLRESSESSAPKPRPKSDLGGSTLASEAMKELLIQGKLLHSQSQKTISEMSNSAYYMSKVRRMSTPHPIKTRHTDRTAPTKLKKTLGRSFSMPENLNKIHKRRRLHPSGSDPLSDLHSHSTNDESSDESEVSMDYSLPDKCHSTRTSQLGLAPVDELFETENLTYAEALWDHVTMDPDELAFRAGDVIKVTDMLDKDWWWGILDDKEGWFPANFVRLRANQEHHLQDAQKTEGSDPNKDNSPIVGKSHQYSVSNEQARTNVINEIITAEREYVRQLDDVLEGYVVQAKKRPDMFPEDKTATIFGNLEDIYIFSKKFLKSIEVSLKDELHQSEIGHCFIEHKKGFEIYSDYCNNHPHACDQLKELCKNKRYRHFFEGCRLLQEMKQIPLEGFLLTPVQKICKYPLQLAELLKYTSTEHPDYRDVCQALDAMKKIACLINERKRRMESIEKIAQWQATVEDWEGPDLLETSSELIYSGELSKVNSSGWTQERYFFLFDHQLIYCRKDLLKKNSFSFRGRIYLDHSKISQVADGRDPQFNVYVKNGWKLHDDKRNKSFLVFSKNAVEKDRWLKAFDEERRKVKSDQENGFTIPANLRKSCVRNSFRKTQPDKPKEKLLKKNASMSFRYQQELWKNLPAHATLPRGITNPTTIIEGPPHPSGNKKRSWFSFTGKKSKR